jgi:MFS transporter, DHA1 family, inner membrane transport protein
MAPVPHPFSRCISKDERAAGSLAIYLGSAMGAAVGALVIADGGVGRLGWVAAGFSVAALLAVTVSNRAASN